MQRLARATPGFSGADLAAIINESALGATLAGKEFIEQDDLEEARDKVRWGRARKSRAIDEKEKIATAYHEAGHAVVQYLEKDADPIHKVTIIPRGNYGGATMALPEKDRMSHSKKWCYAFMKVCFGGRIAEEMFTGDVNTGAAGDIRQATSPRPQDDPRLGNERPSRFRLLRRRRFENEFHRTSAAAAIIPRKPPRPSTRKPRPSSIVSTMKPANCSKPTRIASRPSPRR